MDYYIVQVGIYNGDIIRVMTVSGKSRYSTLKVDDSYQITAVCIQFVSEIFHYGCSGMVPIFL